MVATLEAAEAKPRKPVQWPDFLAIQRGIFGPDLKKRRLMKEDMAFILDRGER